MSLEFEQVTFDMIGCGGGEDDLPLIELVNEEITRLSALVLQRGRDDKATVTVKLLVKAESDTGVVITGTVTSKDPGREARAISALVTGDGRVVTVEHKQQALPNVRPINGGEV
jgi:hypothetical protein